MSDFLSHLLERRVPLLAVWIVVMAVVVARLIAMPDTYTSSALLTPLPLEQVEELTLPGLGGSSVRSLLGKGGTRDDFTVVAFLRSRQLLARVVDDLDLKKELFPERWNARTEEWIKSRGGEPSPGESIKALGRRVDVTYDEFTGLLTLQVHWGNPERAHRVAAGFVQAADTMLREAAVAEGERRVGELRRELESATVGEIGAFLAEEMTRAISSLASIRARARYAFRVIDPPNVPEVKSWPPRFMLLVLAGLVTAGVELGVVAGIYLRRGAEGGSQDDTR
jgi:uncharacterized protein involved in exopolysaccharide biosynthesis